jgi:hypothetical protein
MAQGGKGYSGQPVLSGHLQPFRVISTNTSIGHSGNAEWTSQLLSRIFARISLE